MAEELTNSQRLPLKKLFLQRDNMFASDADLEDTDSLTFWWVEKDRLVGFAMMSPTLVGARGNWLNRVQDVLGASDTAKRYHGVPDSSR